MDRSQHLQGMIDDFQHRLQCFLSRNNLLKPGENVEVVISITSGKLPISFKVIDHEADNQRRLLLGKDITELGLSVRALKILHRLEVTTVGELLQKTITDIEGKLGCGKITLLEIRESLSKIGLSLRRD